MLRHRLMHRSVLTCWKDRRVRGYRSVCCMVVMAMSVRMVQVMMVMRRSVRKNSRRADHRRRNCRSRVRRRFRRLVLLMPLFHLLLFRHLKSNMS